MRAAFAGGLALAMAACSDSPAGPSRGALRSYRPLAARLASLPGYAPCAPPPVQAISCSGEAPGALLPAPQECSPVPEPGTAGFDALAALVAELPGEPDSGELATKRWRSLVGALAWQADSGSLRREIARLEGSREELGARALSDLSAAYLHLAELAGDPEDLIRGYESAQSALAERSGFAPALFNSALVLTRFRLATPATRAWDAFLRSEPRGPWAEEARRLAATLGEGPGEPGSDWASARADILGFYTEGDATALRWGLDPYRQRSRGWVTHELLAEWAEAVQTGRTVGATETLALARAVGQALFELTGDVTLRETVETARGLGAEDRAAFAGAYLQFLRGYHHLYGDWDLALAIRDLRAARSEPGFASSPFGQWAEFYLALATYYQQQLGRAESELSLLSSVVSPAESPVLAARVAWVRGLVAYSLQQPQRAKSHYLEAARLFCRVDERQNLAATLSLLASSHHLLQDYRKTWRLSYGAFRRLDDVFQPLRHAAILEDTVNQAEQQGHLRAALAFAEEHVAIAPRTGSAAVLHNAFMRRGTIHWKLGNQAAADRDFALALSALENLPTPALRHRSDADRDLKRAAALVKQDPGQAIELTTRSLAFYLNEKSHANVPEALGIRAEALLTLERTAEAERDLTSQLEVLELARRGVFEADDRSRYAGAMSKAVARLIRLSSVGGRPRPAFRFSELAAVTTFDDWLKPSHDASAVTDLLGMIPALETLQGSLGKGEAAVSYFELQDHLLVWILTRESFFERRVPLPVTEIRQLIGRHRRDLLSAPPSGGNDAARSLYRALLAPLAELERPPTQLVVVARGPLSALPFETLVNEDTDRLLVQDASIVYAPSLTLHRELATRTDQLWSTSPPRVLAVHGTTIAGSALPRLPGAEREARRVAALFDGGRLVDAALLDARRLTDLMSSADIFHFAGHAVLADGPSRETRLLLGGSDREPRELRPADLEPAHLSRLRLVTLSACGTLSSADVEMGALARPFLAAGVPAVVGSRWDVDDRAAEQLFDRFYRGLAAGLAPVQALRDAQLGMLESDDPLLASPRAWSAFSIVGASPKLKP